MPLPRAVVVLQSPELYLDGLRRRERRGGCGDRVVGVLRAVARRRRGRSAAGVVEGKDGGGVPPAVPMQRTRRLLGEFSLSHKFDRSAWNFVVCRNPSIGSTRKRRGGRRPRAERSWRHGDRLSKKSNSSLRQQSIFFSVRRRPASKRKKQNENCSVPYKGAHSCVPSSVAQHSRTLFLLSHRSLENAARDQGDNGNCGWFSFFNHVAAAVAAPSSAPAQRIGARLGAPRGQAHGGPRDALAAVHELPGRLRDRPAR